MLGRGNTGPVYPWFGKDIRQGVAARGRELRAPPPAVARGCRRLAGPVPDAAPGLHRDAPAARRHPAVRVARVDPHARDRGAGRVLRRRLLREPHLLAEGAHRDRWSGSTASGSSTTGTARADQAIVGLGGQVFMRPNRADAVREFRPYFDHAPVYGGGPSLEDFTRETPLTVGSPEQVIERTLGFRDYVGDYQRQLFLVDHAGLPLKTVLEQIDLLGTEVVPVLRREFDALRPAHVPDGPTHAARLAAARCGRRPRCPAERLRVDRRRRRPRRRPLDRHPGRGRERPGPALSRRGGGVGPMTDRVLTVVSGGLRSPSSTRLLADQLAAAARTALADAGVPVDVRHRRGPGARARDRRRAAHRLPDGRAARRPRRRHGCGCPRRRHADVPGVLQRAVQVLHGPRRGGDAARRAGRARRDRRARSATRSSSSTRCARCSATSARSPSRRASTPRPRTSAGRGARPWPSGSGARRAELAGLVAGRPVAGRTGAGRSCPFADLLRRPGDRSDRDQDRESRRGGVLRHRGRDGNPGPRLGGRGGPGDPRRQRAVQRHRPRDPGRHRRHAVRPPARAVRPRARGARGRAGPPGRRHVPPHRRPVATWRRCWTPCAPSAGRTPRSSRRSTRGARSAGAAGRHAGRPLSTAWAMMGGDPTPRSRHGATRQGRTARGDRGRPWPARGRMWTTGQRRAAPDPWLRDAADVARELGVDAAHGLTTAEAAARLARDGPNELRAKPPVPAWRRLLAQFQDPLVYLLLVAIAISLVAWVAGGRDGDPVDVDRDRGDRDRQRRCWASPRSAAPRARSPRWPSSPRPARRCCATGRWPRCRRPGWCAGDILAPVRGRLGRRGRALLAATGLKVGESSLTGESEATVKSPATSAPRRRSATASTWCSRARRSSQGVGRAVVTGTGMRHGDGRHRGHARPDRDRRLAAAEGDRSVSKALGLIVIGIAAVVMVALAVMNGVESVADLVGILLMGVSSRSRRRPGSAGHPVAGAGHRRAGAAPRTRSCATCTRSRRSARRR